MKPYSEVMRLLRSGLLDGTLLTLCGDEGLLPSYRKRVFHTLHSFAEKFGEERDIAIFSAPGRTEIGGNHTDHQNGCVLAGSVNLDILAVVALREDRMIYVQSEGHPLDVASLDELDPLPEQYEPHANELIRGVVARFAQLGHPIPCGFDAYTTSQVTKGAGMSSSAAFEILIGNICNTLYADNTFTPVELAEIGQYAENVYYRKPCGLMDQMASSVGGACAIDFADPTSPKIRPINFDFTATGYSLCIVNTGGSHADLTDEYAAIPAEMHEVAAYFGKKILTEVDENEFITEIAHLRERCGDRAVLRAMHFFSETKRACAEADALEQGDFDTFLQLVNASGQSSYCLLQNVFPASAPRSQPAAIALALGNRVLRGRGAIRIHGGGFGGTIQAFVPNDIVDDFRAQLDNALGKDSCHILQIRSVGGVTVLI